MTLTFYDLSNHQGGMNLATDSRVRDVEAFIFKATEGTGYVDKYCDDFVQQTKKLNKPFGVYHFMDGSDVTKQAEFFYNNVKGYIGQGIMVLDYEMYGRQGAKAVETFVKRFYELSGVYVWLYMNESDSNNDNWSDYLKKNCGLWIAKYSTQEPNHVKGLNVIAWQYTSTPLDKNVFYGDVSMWNRYANKNSGETTEQINKRPRQAVETYWYGADSPKYKMIKQYLKDNDLKHTEEKGDDGRIKIIVSSFNQDSDNKYKLEKYLSKNDMNFEVVLA